MIAFTSKREKNLWLWALIVLLVIYSTLWLTGLLAEILAENTLLTISFVMGLLLIAITVIGSGLVKEGKWQDLWLVVGVVAVYGMILVRLGIPERSHLIEYSVLALLIYGALRERKKNGGKIFMPPLIAILVTALLGVIDEMIQILIPNRVYDPQDILFNTLAAILAVGTFQFLRWIRNRFGS